MPLLTPKDREALERRFKKDLAKQVTITLYTVRSAGLLVLPGRECPTCPQAQELAKELASLSPKLTLEVLDIYSQGDAVRQRGVERVPAITLSVDGKGHHNAVFYGVPAGMEFPVLLEDIIGLSRGLSPLRVDTRKVLRQIDKDVHIQVFVTPTCPYCPQAARLAHAMAFENPRIRAEVVESQEFPHLATAFAVRAVPKTVINRIVEVMGAVPEKVLLQRVLTAIGRETLLAEPQAEPAPSSVGPTSLVSG